MGDVRAFTVGADLNPNVPSVAVRRPRGDNLLTGDLPGAWFVADAPLAGVLQMLNDQLKLASTLIE